MSIFQITIHYGNKLKAEAFLNCYCSLKADNKFLLILKFQITKQNTLIRPTQIKQPPINRQSLNSQPALNNHTQSQNRNNAGSQIFPVQSTAFDSINSKSMIQVQPHIDNTLRKIKRNIDEEEENEIIIMENDRIKKSKLNTVLNNSGTVKIGNLKGNAEYSNSSSNGNSNSNSINFMFNQSIQNRNNINSRQSNSKSIKMEHIDDTKLDQLMNKKKFLDNSSMQKLPDNIQNTNVEQESYNSKFQYFFKPIDLFFR